MALRRENELTHKNYHLWKKQRLLVLRRDCYTCHYCGNPGANEVDHVIPRVSGGGDELSNLVASCRLCNLKKGKKEQAVFLGSLSTPPVFSVCISPRTDITTQSGPCLGQPEQTTA